jgi:hypothetical protein
VIEKAKCFHPEIFVPSQWIEMIKNAKKREPKFKVTEMATQDFFSTSPLEKDVVKTERLLQMARKLNGLKHDRFGLKKKIL